jgi:hypothetical protein
VEAKKAVFKNAKALQAEVIDGIPEIKRHQ